METRAQYAGKNPDKQFHLRLTADLHYQIKEAARTDRRTMTQIITMAIEEWLAQNQNK